MIKEYKTISEVVGPLMLVKDVENVTYDELGEIILPSGRIMHPKEVVMKQHSFQRVLFLCLKTMYRISVHRE